MRRSAYPCIQSDLRGLHAAFDNDDFADIQDYLPSPAQLRKFSLSFATTRAQQARDAARAERLQASAELRSSAPGPDSAAPSPTKEVALQQPTPSIPGKTPVRLATAPPKKAAEPQAASTAAAAALTPSGTLPRSLPPRLNTHISSTGRLRGPVPYTAQLYDEV